MRRPLVRPPVLRRPDDQEGPRHASWLELFFDLVFVVAIAQLGAFLSRDVSWKGVSEFALLFVPAWWVWAGTTGYSDRFDTDDAVHRGLVALQMVAVCALAVSVHDGLGSTSIDFAISYAAARIILVLMYERAYKSAVTARPLIGWYKRGFTMAALIWIVSAFVPAPVRFVLWGIGVVVDIGTVVTARRLQVVSPLDPAHIPERFGLFVIIVLGEAVLGVVGGLSEQNLQASAVIGAFFALAIAMSIWWIYFDRPDENVAGRMAFAGQIWLYGHLPLVMGIAGAGVAIEHVLASDSILTADRWLLCGSLALAMTATGVIHLTSLTNPLDVMHHVSVLWRPAAAIWLLLLGLVGGGLAPAVLLALAAVPCLAQIGLDIAFDDHSEAAFAPRDN